MLVHELDNFYPLNFKPLSTIFSHTLWREKKLQSSLCTVFPKLLNFSELDDFVDNASDQKIAEYRSQIYNFLLQLIELTNIYYQYNFSNNIKLLNKNLINLRLCIRLFERCKVNLFIPTYSLAIRGGDDFSFNIIYAESIPIDMQNIR